MFEDLVEDFVEELIKFEEKFNNFGGREDFKGILENYLREMVECEE
jgi:hypothetical protein